MKYGLIFPVSNKTSISDALANMLLSITSATALGKEYPIDLVDSMNDAAAGIFSIMFIKKLLYNESLIILYILSTLVKIASKTVTAIEFPAKI